MQWTTMAKTYGITAALLASFCLATEAQAGPRIEFGEEGGYLQVDLKGQVYVENTDYGSGSTNDTSRTDIHFQRNRLTITGMLDEVYGIKFQTCGATGTTKSAVGYNLSAQDVDWNDRDIRIIDAYGIANYDKAFNLKIGLTKIPLTRANLDDCFAPLTQDRSMFVYSAYGTSPAKFSRDLGGVAWGGFFDDKLKYFVGVFQGREGSSTVQIPVGALKGVNATSSNAPKTNLEYVGRLHYSFLDTEPGSGYLGSYLGEKKILTIGGGMAYQPDAAYKNVTNTLIRAVPTDSTSAVLQAVSRPSDGETVDYTAYAADVMFEYPLDDLGVITATAQYLKVDFDDAYKTNFGSGDRLAVVGGLNGQKEGYYVKGAYILPITIGSEGKLQPYMLYEDWKFAHLLGIDDQKVEQIGGGINYYIKGQNVRLTFEYLRTNFDKDTPLVNGPTTVAGAAINVDGYDTFRGMIQYIF